jgi:CBS domain-containing protein
MRRISVGDVMTRKVISVTPGDTLHKCSKLMARERVNSLIVAEGKKLLGILTARDILWAITKKTVIDLKTIRAIDIATRKLAVIKPSADISQALRKMRSLNFRRLPVISNGQIIGVVTLKDILSIEPQLYSEMSEIMDEIRESDRKLKQADDQWPSEGICDNCGALSELLKVEGELLCLDCREELY